MLSYLYHGFVSLNRKLADLSICLSVTDRCTLVLLTRVHIIINQNLEFKKCFPVNLRMDKFKNEKETVSVVGSQVPLLKGCLL